MKHPHFIQPANRTPNGEMEMRYMKPILLTVTLCVILGPSALLRAESPTSTLVGRITYAGPIESGQVVAVTRDSSFCGATTAIHTVTVNAKTRGLQGAVVSIDGDTVPMADSPRRPLVLTNTHCAFSPRIVAGEVGQQLEIRNDDPVMHNTHISMGPRTFVNVAMIPASRPVEKPLKQPGIYLVKCDAHKFMRATVLAFTHPFFSVTDDTGAFQIAQLTPGEHVVRVWHDTLGTFQQRVTIPTRGEATITIEYPAHVDANKK